MPNSYFNLNGPERTPWVWRDKLVAALIWLASYDQDILRKHCPSFELSVAIAIGCVAVISAVFNAVVFAIAGHFLFGSGSFSFGLTFAGLLLALIIAAIESYGGRAMQGHAGAKRLTRSGLVFPHLERLASSLPVFGFYRLGITILTSFVVTVGLSLGIYATDIVARTSADTRGANHAIYQQANGAYEQQLRGISDSEQRESAAVSDLERDVKRLRQGAVRKSSAGHGAVNEDSSQLEKFEKKLAAEKAKLDGLREQSLKLVQSRNTTVSQMMEASPERVQQQEGLIARLEALHSLISSKTSVVLVVLAIDLLLAALDGAGVIVRLCAPTPIYSAIIAKTTVLGSVQQSKECADQLAVYQTHKGPVDVSQSAARVEIDSPPLPRPAAAHSAPIVRSTMLKPVTDVSMKSSLNGASVVRRGPGRPRKDAGHPLNGGEAA
jgi:hypothetical protein